MSNLIIYGGTFDPIHNGHLQVARTIQNYFNFDRFLFLPCKIPILKEPASASAKQRVDMLELALNNQCSSYSFEIDRTEIQRESPSYMVETLQQFRHQIGGEVSITLLLGKDSFYQIPQWHSWQKLLTLANFLVVFRSDLEATEPKEITQLLKKHQALDCKTITKNAHGLIGYYDAGHYPLSSRWIREQCMKQNDLSAYLPPNVWNYIKKNQVYHSRSLGLGPTNR